MVQRLVSRYYKVSFLIVFFIIFDFLLIICSNMLIDGNKFVVEEGEYTYSDLFYSQSREKNYYIFSRDYYDGTNKYTPIDDQLKKVKFTAINEFKSMAMLSFLPSKKNLGSLAISNFEITNEEIQEIYEGEGFVYYGEVYEVFGKIYMFGVYKDYVYTEDKSLSREDNFYLATINWNSESVAFFEVEGLDLSYVKQGEEQKTQYSFKPFVNVSNKPYSFIILTIFLIEIALLFLFKKLRLK